MRFWEWLWEKPKAGPNISAAGRFPDPAQLMIDALAAIDRFEIAEYTRLLMRSVEARVWRKLVPVLQEQGALNEEGVRMLLALLADDDTNGRHG